MPMDGERSWVYDTCNGADRLLVVGGLVKEWMHGGGCGTVLLCNKVPYVDMPFIICTEEEAY